MAATTAVSMSVGMPETAWKLVSRSWGLGPPSPQSAVPGTTTTQEVVPSAWSVRSTEMTPVESSFLPAWTRSE